MSSIFTGMLLVFLNFNLDLGHTRIGLIPTFIGYIFFVRGLSELAEYSNRFTKVVPFAKGMAVFTGITYALDLFGFSARLGTAVSFVLGLITTVISLYISYSIIMGIMDIEATRAQDLNSAQLLSTWKLLATFSLITYLLLLVPAIAMISIIASFIIGIYYLYIFSKSKNLFAESNQRPQ